MAQINLGHVVGPQGAKGDKGDTGDPSTVMTGATSTADGTSGAAPKPTAGQQGRYLKGDASWGEVADTEMTENEVNICFYNAGWDD